MVTKKALFISIDIYRNNEPEVSYSITSILAYLRNDNNLRFHDKDYDYLFYKLSDTENYKNILQTVINKLKYCDYKYIFLPVYCWTIYFINELITVIKEKSENSNIVLGGYEITCIEDCKLKETFPNADYFIKGYAEESVRRILLETDHDIILKYYPDYSQLPSIYLTKLLNINNIDMLRWETKRGCQYHCEFCEWSNSIHKNIYEFPIKQLKDELQYFKTIKTLKKINVIDPTFNCGKNYLSILEDIIQIPNIQFNFQIRIENIKGNNGKKFLDMCFKSKNIYLECGIQTLIDNEMVTLGRKNDIKQITRTIFKFQKYGIPYEINLIYGIPGQTIKSFQKSIRYLINIGVPENKIICYRLRLPNNNLIRNKDLKITEIQNKNNFNISEINTSSTFNEKEMQRMRLNVYSLTFKDSLLFPDSKIFHDTKYFKLFIHHHKKPNKILLRKEIYCLCVNKKILKTCPADFLFLLTDKQKEITDKIKIRTFLYLITDIIIKNGFIYIDLIRT